MWFIFLRTTHHPAATTVLRNPGGKGSSTVMPQDQDRLIGFCGPTMAGVTEACQGSYCWARENWTRVRIGAAAAGKKWHAGYTQFLCKFVCSFIFYKWNWKIEAKGIDEWCQSVEMSMWEGSPVLGWWLLRGGKLSNFVSPIVSDGFQHKSNFGTSILRFLHKL